MRELLRIVTCGSVDDGKSTLIGRLLYDADLLTSDQRASLVSESRTVRRDGTLDYALLLDGLLAEREQGITIDVAYRFFSTKRRSFAVADAPGHEEYTRNMAVGASFADLAVLLVDASRGVLNQTRRHLRICALMGIRHFVFAVNKMDLVGYSADAFRAIEAALCALAEPFTPASLIVIPTCATRGENVTRLADSMPWYKGTSLLTHLEEIAIPAPGEDGTILPVQRVSRPDDTSRWYQGQLTSGTLRIGDAVTLLPSQITTTVSGLLVSGVQADTAEAGMAVSVMFANDVDCARGSVITRNTSPACGSHFVCDVLWMDDAPLTPERRLRIKLATRQTICHIRAFRHRIDITTGAKEPTASLEKNALGRIELSCAEPLVFDPFDRHRSLGRFLLIDALTGQTAGCGVIRKSVDPEKHLVWQESDLSRSRRAKQLGQHPKTIWFTGLPGAGKTTLANALEVQLAKQGFHTMLLDGDNVRLGLNQNLGFSDEDRAENIRRVAEVAKLMNDAGLIVLAAFVSPRAADREVARQIVGPADFIEVHVSTPLAECERRDVKGQYQKARNGGLPGFTGVGSPYEVPENAAITVDTTGKKAEEAAKEVAQSLDLLH